MANDVHDIGDRVTFAGTFADANGAAADPTTVQFLLKSPAGVETIYTAATGLTNPAIGSYSIDITLTESGTYYWRFNGTGAVEESIEGFCKVRTTHFDEPLPLGAPPTPGSDPPDTNDFLQWTSAGDWEPSLWTLPRTAPATVGHVLTVSSAGVTAFQAPLAAPANPGDNAKFARALNGNLEYVVAKESYLLSWGANGPGTGSGSTNYLCVGGGNQATGTLTGIPGAIVMLDDGTLDILQVIHGNPAALGTLTYTIEVNEGATALTLALSSSSSQGSNITDVVNVVRGDRVRCTVTNPGSSNTNIRLGVNCRFRRTLGT